MREGIRLTWCLVVALWGNRHGPAWAWASAEFPTSWETGTIVSSVLRFPFVPPIH